LIEISGRFVSCFASEVASKTLLYRVVKYTGLRCLCRVLYNVLSSKEIQILYNDYSIKGNLSANIKILHLSDLHLDNNTYRFTDLCEKILNIQYDIAIITGDFFDSYINSDSSNKYLEELCDVLIGKSINKMRPIVTLGNHDASEMIPILESIGYIVLLNENFFMNINGVDFAITGIDDTSHFYSRNSLRCALTSSSHIKILAAHTPELADFYSKKGYDLYICGHTHGGQIAVFKNMPIFKGLKRNKKLFSGKWRVSKMNGYTTRGVGCSLLPIRINVTPEITVHTLKISKNDN
jgi:predicted MPP superfamily phosphohydrolase